MSSSAPAKHPPCPMLRTAVSVKPLQVLINTLAIWMSELTCTVSNIHQICSLSNAFVPLSFLSRLSWPASKFSGDFRVVLLVLCSFKYHDGKTDNVQVWYWFFAARSQPSTAPLVLWLNGGPGCSSMIGLFQEHGPCHFVGGSSKPSLNQYSWNNVANMLYVDQVSKNPLPKAKKFQC